MCTPPPRPILKSLPEYSPLPFSSYPLHSPHVHFPPTPALTSTSFTHSPFAYDRAPIVVSENLCALPERGGRCYTLQPRNKRSSRGGSARAATRTTPITATTSPEEPKGSYFHPRAFEACEPESSSTYDRDDCYDPYSSPSEFSSSCSSSSSSSSSSSDSDSPCGSPVQYTLSLSSSIPRVVVHSTPDAPSTYPSDTSHLLQHAIQSQLDSSQQQTTALVHYPCPSAAAECKSKKGTGNRGRVRISSSVGGGGGNHNSLSATARLARFGGGFSDQAAFLEGCLGGF